MLQAGTAVLVDAYGVPRVKCNCGNPLTPPAAVRVRPTYRGPRWRGFSPTTVVVVTSTTEPPTTEPSSTEPPSTEPPTSEPPDTSGGDVEQFCSKWSGYLAQYGELDPSVPEVVSIFEDLASVAPPEMQQPMQVILAAVRDAAASGAAEIDANAYPGVDAAILSLIDYLSGTCGIATF